MIRLAGRARPAASAGVRRRGAAAAVALVLGAGSACSPSGSPSGGASSSVAGSPEASGSAAASPSVEPFTEPGSELEVGQPARLRWSPKQGLSGEVEITVTGLERTSFDQTFRGWQLSDRMRKRSPYFIRATVENIGRTGLGGYQAPLYGLDARDNLVQASTFDGDFTPCRPAALPKRFRPGASVKVCLVVLVPSKGDLVGATFRPSEDLDPITWTGPVTAYRPGGKKKGRAGGAGQGQRQGDRGGASPTP